MTPPRRWRFPTWLFPIGVMCLFFLLLLTLFMPSPAHHHGGGANRAKCANNLRQIALAAIMYANENGGHFPMSAQVILANTDITSEVFVCPSTNDTRATGATLDQIVANLTAGGHLSYTYCGQGLTVRTDSDHVVAIEPLGNHDGDGANVVFTDAHVEWFNTAQAKVFLDQIHNGAGPVRWPVDRGQPAR